jgi:hypothetical protein
MADIKKPAAVASTVDAKKADTTAKPNEVKKSAAEANPDDVKRAKWKTFKQGVEDSGGDKIVSVINLGDKSCVYLYARSDDEVLLAYDNTSDCEDYAQPAATALSLQMRVISTLPKIWRFGAIQMIASCLGFALEKKESDKQDYLTEAKELVDTRITSYMQLQYLAFAFGVTSVLSVLIFALPVMYQNDALLPLLGAAFGVLGAFVSVSRGSRKLRLKSIPQLCMWLSEESRAFYLGSSSGRFLLYSRKPTWF